MRDSTNLDCKSAMIHVASAVSPYSVLSYSINQKLFFGLANLLLHYY